MRLTKWLQEPQKDCNPSFMSKIFLKFKLWIFKRCFLTSNIPASAADKMIARTTKKIATHHLLVKSFLIQIMNLSKHILTSNISKCGWQNDCEDHKKDRNTSPRTFPCQVFLESRRTRVSTRLEVVSDREERSVGGSILKSAPLKKKYTFNDFKDKSKTINDFND